MNDERESGGTAVKQRGMREAGDWSDVGENGEAVGRGHRELRHVTYDEWEPTIPLAIRRDVIWRVQAYRLALYLAACAEQDAQLMKADARFDQTISQLCRAAASVAANIAEGYPRQSGRDRIRYYEYALGSAAEVKVWYLSARTTLAPGAIEDRFALLRSITRLLLTMIRSARSPKSSSFRLAGSDR